MSGLAVSGSEPHWSRQPPVLILLVFIAVALGLKLRLDHSIDVHWDEFNYLAKVHLHGRGELQRALLTFHVHAFGWLRQVPGNEIDQVVAARDWMFGLRLASSLCLFLIGRRLMGATGAAFAVLCSLSFSHVLKHGESFRFDPILSFFFLLACCLLILRPGRVFAGVAAGISLAIAALVTLKLALLLPSIAIVFAVQFFLVSDRGLDRQLQRRAVTRQAIGCGLGLGVAFAVLYFLHAAALASASSVAFTSTLAPADSQELALASDAASAYLGLDRLFPNIIGLARSLRWDVGFWLLLVVGSGLALGEVVRGSAEVRRRALLILALALPMTTLVFYPNAFAYFYVVLIPPASLLCGLVAARLTSGAFRTSERPLLATGIAVLLALPVVVQGARFYRYNARDALARQHELVATVRSLFPQPVPYIDRCNMIASFPKVGPFMITSVMRGYRAIGQPVMEEELRNHQPVFLLQNVESLNLGRDWEEFEDHPLRLLREDFELLRQHFVRHWGPIWVAGKRFPALGDELLRFEILIGGRYTLEASGAMWLDGQLERPGSVVHLEPGSHRIRPAARQGRAMLRYGEGLPQPEGESLRGTFFSGLGFRTTP